MKTNLEWLITASGLKNIRCVACSHLLKNGFDSVSVMDSPKSVRWVKPDELVITTGYFLINNEEGQKNVIHELKKAGCAGLGIKIKSYFKQIPERMLKEAEEAGLPILEIPYYYSLSEISQTIFGHIFEINYQSRIREQRLIEDISDIFFSKRGVMEIVYRIAEFMKRTVILTDSDLKCIYAAKRMKDKQVCTKDDAIKKVSMSEDGHNIFSFPDKTQRAVYYVAIPNADSFLLVLEDGVRVTKDEECIIERCTKILSMGLEQVRAKHGDRFEFENAYYKELYEYLSGLRQCNDAELRNIFQEIEIPIEKKRVMLLFQIERGTGFDSGLRELIQYKITKGRETRGFESCIFYHNDKYIVYLFTDTNKSDPFVCHSAKKLAEEIRESFSSVSLQAGMKVGISKSSQDIGGIRKAYQEAVKAIDIGERLGLEESVFLFSTLEFYDYLLQYPLKNKKQLSGNIQYLLYYDEQNNTELAQTLLKFLEYKFNMSDTAKALYIHRNTLLNRMGKIKELLYNNLETMDELIPLCMEACAYQLFS